MLYWHIYYFIFDILVSRMEFHYAVRYFSLYK